MPTVASTLSMASGEGSAPRPEGPKPHRSTSGITVGSKAPPLMLHTRCDSPTSIASMASRLSLRPALTAERREAGSKGDTLSSTRRISARTLSCRGCALR